MEDITKEYLYSQCPDCFGALFVIQDEAKIKCPLCGGLGEVLIEVVHGAGLPLQAEEAA